MVPYLKDPQAIYERSFAIVREQALLDEVPEDLREVAVRVIHACGMPDIVGAIDASPDFASRAVEALRNGAPVLCDCEMVASGITRRFLNAGNDVIVTLNDPEVPARAKAQQTTRSAAAVDFWRPWIDGSVIVVGNAPTTLFRCLELIEEEGDRPAAIIGCPVGFVGAAESKAALAATKDMPFFAVHGTRGGSAMASAVVNALALLGRGTNS